MRPTGNEAVFPTVAAAKSYAAAIAQPGNWSANIIQKGRTVTFDLAVPEQYKDEVYFSDFLDRVGYYGSTQSRKATLNGVPAPMSY